MQQLIVIMRALQSIYNYDLIHLFIITSLVCGLEFCTASAFTYIPPILLKAGISESSMTWLMGCGPLLGFLLCPVVGHASDRCRSRFGKRRPFILGFCLTIIFCLILIPQSEAIGKNQLPLKSFMCIPMNILFFYRWSFSCAQNWTLSLSHFVCPVRFFCSSLF